MQQPIQEALIIMTALRALPVFGHLENKVTVSSKAASSLVVSSDARRMAENTLNAWSQVNMSVMTLEL